MQLIYAGTAAVIGALLAGCQSTAYDANDYSPLPPIQAQPVPSVRPSVLAPASSTASQFPAAPTKMPSRLQQPPIVASVQDVTKETMVGSWKVGYRGSSCNMFLTLTNLGSGSRGGTRGCTGELTSMGSWDVSDKHVILKNRDGTQIGTLYKISDSHYDGSTASGQPLSLTR